MRYPARLFATFFCLFTLFSFAPAALAQAPAYPGAATKFTGSNQGVGYDLTLNFMVFVDSPASANLSGWTITRGIYNTITVTPPTNATFGTYTVGYVDKQTYNHAQDTYVDTGLAVTFQVVAAPPTKPAAAPGPAFSWQGSVAGINTGNGNKLTTVPLVGWTQRGGMGVSCALFHNSQGSNYGPLSYGAYGTKWTPSYFSYITTDGSGNPTIHWDNGQTHAYLKNGSAFTAPYGILDTLTSVSGGKYKLTTPGQTVLNFSFIPTSGSAYPYLSSMVNLDGNTLTINHNSDATLHTLVDATGRTLTYNYTGTSPRLSSVSDPLSRTWTFTYDGSAGMGNLWYVTLPVLSGTYYSTYFGYDSNHNITAQMNPRGYSATFFYNANNSLAWAKDPLGNQTSFTYNATNTVITDPNGHTLTHAYVASRLDMLTDALGKTESYIYDYNNILSSKTDKRGNVWSYSSHFSNGTNVSTSADAMSPANQSSETYDPSKANKIVSSADAVGNTTAYTYSTNGKFDLLTAKVTGTGAAPFTATTTTGGYSNGLPATFQDAAGSPQSSVGYNANGYVTTATDGNGHAATATYDALGLKLTSADALTHTVTCTPDAWERITDVKAPDNTHTATTYDPDGNVLTVTDANNHTVTNQYDADDRLTQTTNGRGDIVKYTYDGTDPVTGASQKGLLSSKTDGNNHVTFYSYTARNEPYQTFYADGTSESIGTTATNGYDANGNVLLRVKPDGKQISYLYDNDNRLTKITYPNLPPTTFGYDGDSRRTSMSDGTGTTTWTYEDGLHLTQVTSPQGTVSYGYDLDSRRTTLAAAPAGQSSLGTWTSHYDSAGLFHQLDSPTDGSTVYTYDNADRLTQKVKGNGEYETYAYDTADQLTGLGYYWADTTLHNSLTYGYDSAGNVNSCNQGYYATTYGYDGADQLVSETSTGTNTPPSYGYTYDHNGNRLTQTQNGVQIQSFVYNAHDVLATGTAGSETDGYDLNGSETSLSIYGGCIIWLMMTQTA